MPEAITKFAVNDTLGTENFKPLNKTVSDDAYDAFYNMISAVIGTYGNNVDTTVIYPYGIQSVRRGSGAYGEASPFRVAIFPNTIFEIAENGFSNSSVEQIFLPPSLKQIKEFAFSGCELRNVIIPERVEYLESECFSSNESLTRVAFKGTPKEISSTAFSQCDNLKNIHVPWKLGEVANAPWGATNAYIHYKL